jgi:hypothetical protein
MKSQRCFGCVSRIALLLGLLVNTARSSGFLMNVDFGVDVPSGKMGPAAIGRTPTDYWNVYLRNDGLGSSSDHWRTHGVMNNLSLADGTASAVGMTVDNAAGGWSLGFSDPMYNDYIYPYPSGGNATITLTGLSAGLYDLYAYSVDGNYEVTVGAFSYGTELTFDSARTGASVWTEGVQYARFRNVALDGSEALTLTARDGQGGWAIISGFQLVAVPEPSSAAFLGCMLAGSLAWKRFRRYARS